MKSEKLSTESKIRKYAEEQMFLFCKVLNMYKSLKQIATVR